MTDAGLDVIYAGDFLKPEFILGRNIDIEAQIKRAVSQGASPEIVGEMKGLTGLIAEIDTGRPGPVTAIRFDIDCVDTTETEEGTHLPMMLGFNSVNANCMHACAHDGHTAVGIALAEQLFIELMSIEIHLPFAVKTQKRLQPERSSTLRQAIHTESTNITTSHF